MHTLSETLSLADEYQVTLPPMLPIKTAPTGGEIAAWIDHTLLKPEATIEQIEKLCQEALQFGFASVCVNPVYVPLAFSILKDSPVKVCTVIGFPLGAALASCKASEADACLQAGAREIDMVLTVGLLKSKAYEAVFADVAGVVQVSRTFNALVKVILETSALTRDEKILASVICKNAGADFIKTSTGFGAGGATADDVNLMYRIAAPQVSVKASGGIRTLADAQMMIQAGATRLGTSAGVAIVSAALAQGKGT
jgi:deoxyribose-phosphate aldolase